MCSDEVYCRDQCPTVLDLEEKIEKAIDSSLYVYCNKNINFFYFHNLL